MPSPFLSPVIVPVKAGLASPYTLVLSAAVIASGALLIESDPFTRETS